MQKTPSASRPRPIRSLVFASATLWLSAMLVAGGCSPDDSAVPVGGAGTAPSLGNTGGTVPNTTGGSAVTAGTGGSGSVVTGGAGTTGGSSSVTAGTSSSSGGTSSSSGGTSSSSGGTSSSGGAGGSAPKPCIDSPPPYDPKWPDATCENWATETTSCNEAWFKTYCDVSCKRCTPAGGGGAGSGGSGSGGAPAVDCSTKGLPNVTGGNGYATRYWDCCQPHCAQNDGHKCNQDGTTRSGGNQSACSGGNVFACYDEAPKAVDECVSYGYIAKSNPNCGGCYRIQFTGEGQHNAKDPGSVAIKGKQMIVKVSNTGGDVANNQFDLMIPGGGVGQFNACSKQWGTSDLGAQYGGFLASCTGSYQAKKDCVKQQCMKIPAGPARDGCNWFVDWFQIADNPKFTSQATNCPF